MKKLLVLLSISVSLPFLVSLDSSQSSMTKSTYKSPEGILFVSKSIQWDQTDLQALYLELKKNKHGEEFNSLNKVVVQGEEAQNLSPAKYNPFTKTITLYRGNNITNPSSYRETLSHEYGHHFSYYYFKAHHFPFSKWSRLRGLNNKPIRWDAFWNYSLEKDSHKWYPQEILADDYVLLYGATKNVEEEDIYSNEAYYLRTEHENQELLNILEEKQLQTYLEEETGLKIDEDRIIETPVFQQYRNGSLIFKVSEKARVAYRLNLSLYFQTNERKMDVDSFHELYVITTKNSNGKIEFAIEDVIEEKKMYGDLFLKASIDLIDLDTNLGFGTANICFDQNKPSRCTNISNYES